MKIIQKDQSLISNLFGFMRFPLVIKNKYNLKDKFNTIIIGIPCEITSTGKPGSKLGPNSIRKQSINLFWEKKKWPWNISLKKYLKIIDGGDLIYKQGNIKNLNKKISKLVTNLLKIKKNIIFIGGDHYITLPILRIYKKFYKKISLIHFDAHTDIYYDNNIYDHGSIIYQIKKEKLVSIKNIIQIGIRTYINKKNKINIINAEKTNSKSTKKIIKKIINTTKNLPTYITFDIDCIDPSYAPGTGTPVIGGITIHKILKIIRKLKKINIIGFDLVEVSPIYDKSGITSLTAANIILDFIYLQAYKIKKKIKNG